MNRPIEITEPSTPEELEAYFEFRWRQLREPWDQPRGSEQDEFEQDAYHVMARSANGELVGIGRVHLPESGTAQIRYMATAQRNRRLGIGTAIVQRLEQTAAGLGATRIMLNARLPAIPFYEKLGYAIIGDGATLFGTVAHKRMEKRL